MHSISQGIFRFSVIAVIFTAYLWTINPLGDAIYAIEAATPIGEQAAIQPFRYIDGIFVVWALPLVGLAGFGAHSLIETMRFMRRRRQLADTIEGAIAEAKPGESVDLPSKQDEVRELVEA